MAVKKAFHVIAVSHLDLGFVMPEEELDELLEIYVLRMLDVLEQNPKLSVAIEQMAHYRKLKTRRNDLFLKVKEYIKKGRIEVMGAMASSMETNFPNGECFVRNQTIGLKWAKENFDIVPNTGWLVDTFGMNAQLPQVYKQFGINRVMANRFGGDKTQDLFYSCGLDGSEILVSGIDIASMNVQPNTQAFKFCRNRNDTNTLFKNADKLRSDLPKLVVYYMENEEVFSTYFIELANARNQRADESWELSSYQKYLDIIENQAESIKKLNGDLNPEFTGTFALRTPIKICNRIAETALLEAEKWTALLTHSKGYGQFENLWWDMAFNQFHDVFTGSHQDVTFDSVLNKYSNIIMESEKAIAEAAMAISSDGNGLVCFNGLPFSRTEWVLLSEGSAKSACVSKGKVSVPMAFREEKTYFKAELPPLSAVQFELLPVVQQKKQGDMEKRHYIENDFLRLELSEQDGIQSLSLKNGTVILENVADFLVAQQDTGGLQIENATGYELYAMSGESKISDVLADEMGETINISGVFPEMPWNKGQNKLEWSADFSLRKDENAVRLHLTVDWLGEGTRIRLKLPTQINTPEAIHEIPFGTVKRKAYSARGTAKGEWPAHRFVAIEDENKGLGLVNRGIAGVELVGSTLLTTLIRAYQDSSAAWVKPTAKSSQHGKSEFDFMIIPYSNSFQDAGVLSMAQEFNNPVILLENKQIQAEALGSYLSIADENIVLSSIKQADDESGDIVIRYYEAIGQQTKTTIAVRNAVTACLSDLKEQKGDLLKCQNGEISIECSPFEIQTIRVKL